MAGPPVAPDPRPDLEPVKAIFSGAHAQWWHTLYTDLSPSLEAHFFRQRRDVVLALLAQQVPRRGRILDMGCGTGPVLAELRAAGWRCTGLDAAPDMLAEAHKRLSAAGLPTGDLHQGDGRAAPFPNASFDAVLCLGVISYTDHYAPILAEVRRLLRPGGVAIVTCRNAACPVWSDPWRLATRAVRWMLRRPPSAAPFSPGRFLERNEVGQALHRAGLAVDREIGIGFGPPRLAGSRWLSDASAIRLSDALARLATQTGTWSLARRVTDISLWVVRSADAPIPA